MKKYIILLISLSFLPIMAFAADTDKGKVGGMRQIMCPVVAGKTLEKRSKINVVGGDRFGGNWEVTKAKTAKDSGKVGTVLLAKKVSGGHLGGRVTLKCEDRDGNTVVERKIDNKWKCEAGVGSKVFNCRLNK